MNLIYLDYNCFQRGFDDPQQVKIQLEALACEEVFKKAEVKTVRLVWSFMHEDENLLCPFLDRKLEVARLSALCKVRIGPNKEIYDIAKGFQQRSKLSAKDAIHLACAYSTKSSFFLTCDEKLIKRAGKLNLEIEIMNPVDYIREVK
ncbi:MAG: PIN domain-containing protein [Nitrospiraceae bacterium]|nr:MAG: PIN domain-containing protein [Nitrospiraceae bacterium]